MNYNLENKTIIVTGANSGIGRAAAIQLAKLGATVIMACLDGRGEKALDEVKNISKSEKVVLMQIDMSSQASIRKFAYDFIGKYKKLDVLIHNAANLDHTLNVPTLTEDRVETVFATNHVGIALLTHLLLDLLKQSAPSRIITVASKGLMTYPFLDIEFDNLNGERKFNLQHAYYHAKLAQVMYTYDLADQLKNTGVTVNCVRVTNVAIPDDRLMHLPEWLRKVYNLKRKMAITSERQAETYVYLAAEPEIEKVTSGYWDENNKQVNSSKNSYNPVTWHKLREVTKKMAGMK